MNALSAFVSVMNYIKIGFAAYKAISGKVAPGDVGAIMGFVPELTAICHQVQIDNPNVPGATKLEIIKNIVQMSYQAAPQLASLFETEWVHISALISAVVDTAKKLNVIPSDPPTV